MHFLFKMKRYGFLGLIMIAMFVLSYCILTVYFTMYLHVNTDSNFHINANDKTSVRLKYYSLVESETYPTRRATRVCERETTNFAFIKCMKCATETLASIFRRFGYVRDLNFVLPVNRNIFLGWPFAMEELDMKPASSTGYNVLVEHSVFNHTFMSSFMPVDTKFITIIRSPWKQFKSAFSYFNIGEVVKVPSATAYLRNIEHYDRLYGQPENRRKRWCIPDGFSMTRNILSHCLGMPLGFPTGRPDIHGNRTAVMQYIQHLDNTFTLVMIADYFLQSLILLKRVMCWSFKDIVSHYTNAGNYSNSGLDKLSATGDSYRIHKRWSNVDYQLFEHFNATFWRRVHLEGPGFREEVEHFRLVQLLVERFCFRENMWKVPTSILHIPASRFDAAFNISGQDCVLMNTYLLPMLWLRYYQKENVVPDAIPSMEPMRGCTL